MRSRTLKDADDRRELSSARLATKLGRRSRCARVALALLVPTALACGGDGPGDSDSDSTTGQASAGETSAEAPDLEACHMLARDEGVTWEEGPSLEPSGVSTPARVASAGAQTWALALDLLEVTPTKHRSVAHSPTSMSLALGLSYKRWREQPMCSASILGAMHAVESGDELHQTMGASVAELEARALPAAEDEDPVLLSLRSSIWQLGSGGASDSLYGATLHNVSGPLEGINAVMNCVIEEQSSGLLVDFIPADLPAADTTSFDVNVAFLQAPWGEALQDRGSQPFQTEQGPIDQAMMGRSYLSSEYFEDSELEAVILPLRGGALSIMLVMPRAQAFASLAEFTGALTRERLESARDGAQWGLASLTMPKFTIDSTTIDYYKPLGFMCELYTLRTVLHGAAVELDERGIKAAAATVNENWGSSAPDIDFTVTFDRPFLFFVFDETTGFVLYSGRYAGPETARRGLRRARSLWPFEQPRRAGAGSPRGARAPSASPAMRGRGV